ELWYFPLLQIRTMIVARAHWVLTPKLLETEEYPKYFQINKYQGELVWVRDMNWDLREQYPAPKKD
ncbi:hypothetical protein AX16_001298, partial [Volvariella volvacea WC 439]